VRNPYYPDNGAPARGPDYVDPVDCISPHAAVYAARLLGCRLPSSLDWRGAVAKFPPATTNLRDPLYTAQHAHIAGVQRAANNNAEYPNYSMLKPTPAKLTELKVAIKPAEQDAEAATDKMDGHLYFAPVDFGSPGEVFRNLVGNVWEYVFEEPAAMDALPMPATVQAINDLVRTREQRERVRVIGGSAISPKELPVDQPLDFNWGASRAGFSDAGFRLAFSTGAGTGGTGKPAERLAKILSSDYLARGTP
jgi:formylglycine-generating enzyme required for sulfatase activity